MPEITLEELIEVRNTTPIKFDDNQEDKSLPPFVQADSFDRIISLLVILSLCQGQKPLK